MGLNVSPLNGDKSSERRVLGTQISRHLSPWHYTVYGVCMANGQVFGVGTAQAQTWVPV